MDDEAMFVRTQSLPQTSQRPMTVRVHTPIGSVVVLWGGAPQEADGQHLVEWTVDDDVHWGQNTRPAPSVEAGLRQEGDRVIMRGLLHLTENGAAHLQMGPWSVLFDLATPIPSGLDESWVDINVRSESVALHPYQT
ncbi:hypothetical protein OG206_32235 [Streptomyces sp. NBC_01341]|uniref:hypothetical protein n=1 Tax=Streptomyces sp. NBC_01341 TaxID=2903831 RepID=UPI002E14A723|nr:hypothetical protein OG206_32235 [Streptomyces sp. NBC_01341]